MKPSKKLPEWQRKKCWSIFINMTLNMRYFVYNNSFKSMCKTMLK